MAFKIAASMATEGSLEEGGAVLLEPMMKVEVVTPKKIWVMWWVILTVVAA